MNTSLYSFDVWSREVKSFRLENLRDVTNCPTCKGKKFEYLTGESAPRTTTLCGRNAVQVTRPDRVKLNFEQLASRFRQVGEAKFNPFMLQAKVDRYEFTVFPDGRAIIKGTNDPAQAKTIYSKYIGV